jgi:hypothetical protein
MNLELPLDGTTRSKLRPTSKALFRSDFALEAYLLIAGQDRFYKGQLAKATGCQANFAGDFLRRLESNRLIERLPQEEGQTRHYYRKLPSPIWTFIKDLAQGILDQPEGTVTQLPSRSRP